MEKTVHLKRGTKNLGKRSEFETLVQVKQTVNHSETTARNKFQKNKEKWLVDPFGGGETAGTLVFLEVVLYFFSNQSNTSNKLHVQIWSHDLCELDWFATKQFQIAMEIKFCQTSVLLPKNYTHKNCFHALRHVSVQLVPSWSTRWSWYLDI